MKDKNMIWYLGYVISIILVLIIFLTDFSKMVDIGLALLLQRYFPFQIHNFSITK